MDFQAWTFPTPDSMYAPTNFNSPFSSNVSSYFHRPSKIVKPNSRNVSPRHSGRRGTTSSVPSRTRSLLDRQRASLQRQFIAQQGSRPLSWHPNSYSDTSYSNQSAIADVSNSFYPQYMHGTAAINGLITPMTYPIPDEPQIQELISPLEELSAGTQYDVSNMYSYPLWTGPDFSKQQLYVMDNMFPQQQQQQQQQQQLVAQSWMSNMHFHADAPTAPSSPLFLPIQGGVEASPLNLNTGATPIAREEGEELVGMGLYDSPADVQSSLLFGGGMPNKSRKRSLKLEESFEPAPESSEAEETDEEEDEDADADSTEPLPVQPTSTSAKSMAGHSFLFETEADTNTAQYPSSYSSMPQGGYQMSYPAYGWI